MTDHDGNIDDLASAFLDDELSADERAGPAGDDAVLARAGELSSVREALRSADLPPVDPAQRERALAAALAAFSEGGVVSIAAARSRRGRRAAQLVGVAAAVALLALAVPFLGDLDSGSDDAVVAGRAGSSEQTMNADASAPISPEALSVAPGGPLEDLGAFEEVAELAEVVRTRLDGAAAEASPATGGSTTAVADDGEGADDCAAERERAVPVTFVARAELDGRAVLVLVHSGEDSQRTLVVLDLVTCAEVASQVL